MSVYLAFLGQMFGKKKAQGLVHQNLGMSCRFSLCEKVFETCLVLLLLLLLGFWGENLELKSAQRCRILNLGS